ncbi:MAG: carboxypeptidase regulatory-like domain-containing protein [Planctomycetes bacterium]|nr:carboxypeptidase regulatory-like domain-containing protein [Planctomycetota bacterium]
MNALLLVIAGSWVPASVPQETPTVLSGTVTVKGEVKKVKPTPIPCPHCAPLYPQGRMPREDILLGPDNGIQGAFVFVKRGLEGRTFDVPKTPVLLNQKNCRYEPRVVGVRVGQELAIRNSDPHDHCVHGLPFLNREFNTGQAAGAPDIVRKFDRSETMIKIIDNVHPWMAAWVGVVDHPFFAVTDAKGNYEIKGLPPGNYTVEVWHESFRSVTPEIEIKAKSTTTLDAVLETRKG